MSSNVNAQPISLAEHRASREATSKSLTPEQQQAYRRLALTVLGLDLASLTADLRARRFQAMPKLQVLPESDRAA
jgi:hypothetical protein